MRPRLFLGAAPRLLALAAFPAMAAPPTSIILDGSFGRSGAVSPTSPGFYEITPSMGKAVGSNLFQSFGTFNLGTGDTADFEANAGTQNIIARVTGGSASTIDGTITSTVGGPSGPLSNANLFFINPAGLLFTANAQLNLNGAFVASTADYAKFSDGTTFYADVQHPINDAGLTSAPISAFGFITFSQAPSALTLSSTSITTSGSGLYLVVGSVTLEDSQLSFSASDAKLAIISAASNGKLSFSLNSSVDSGDTVTAFGNVTLQNGSSVNFAGSGGGNLVIRAGRLVVDNSEITSANSGSAANEALSVQASKLVLQNGGQIVSSTSSSGSAGDISVESDSVSIEGANSGIFAESLPASTSTPSTTYGNAGNINVQATNLLSITDGGQISSSTMTSGVGGNVSVTAGALTIDGLEAPSLATGINSNANAGSTGNAGSVSVTVAGASSISSGGQIASNTFGLGDGGSVTVRAGSLAIDGSAAPNNLTGISSDSGYFDESTGGNAGSVVVEVAGALSLTGGGQISSSNFALGNGGSVSVRAASLDIAGAGPLSGSGISCNSVSIGNAGSIAVDVAGTLSLAASGAISSSAAHANGGDIAIQAANLTLQDGGTIKATAGIAGGSIDLQVGQLLYLSNSEITALSFEHGGDITIDPRYSVLNNSLIEAADVASEADILFVTNYLLLNESEIIANNIQLPVHETIDLAAGLTGLPTAPSDEEKLLRESCTRSVKHDYSSLIVVGRGGTELAPDELQPDFGVGSF